MISENLAPPVAHDPAAEATTEARPLRTTSLGDVVERRKHLRAFVHHPSSAPVSPSDRIVKTASAKKIVIVDDEPDQVDMAVMVLEAAGHIAHGTTNGPMALELVVKHAADLLLMDFMMPNMSGGAVGRALRADAERGQTKIVVLSGTAEDVVRAEFDDFQAFLQKPVHPDRLLRTVEDL